MSPSPPDLADLSLLSGLAPELASTFVKLAGDIALVIGDDGVIRSVAEGQVAVPAAGQHWVGRAWVDTVTADTRRKIELLLQEAAVHGVSRRREVSHPGEGGGDIPVSWAAVRLGQGGPVLAVGRDLRAVAAIQQRFVDAQQEMERDYWQRRQAETRYRLLFQVARDAVLVLDAETATVLEANPTAALMFDPAAGADSLGSPGPGPARPQDLVGQRLRERIDAASRPAVDELLAAARSTGRAFEVRARLAHNGAPVDLSATPFRSEERHCLLVRARNAAATAQPGAEFFAHMPDAAVITDSSGRIRMANPAFVKLCQAPDETRLRGWLLGDALGDLQRQWPELLAQVRANGLVGRASVRVHVAGGPGVLAEVSGALLAEGEQEDFGFTLRLVPESALPSPAERLAQGLAGLVQRLGEQPLPELLLQARLVAERHLLDAALQRVHGDLEAAAQLLQLPLADLRKRLQLWDRQAGATLN